jgi:Zn-dependent peptidase ImmA (M78 family)
MTKVAISIPVLRWAARRAQIKPEDAVARYPKWAAWLAGEAQPTLRQVEDFARWTHTPFGYFFLPEPPVTALPVPDFRTLRDSSLTEPSGDLLETLYLCQQRQAWYHDFAQVHGFPVLAFVGSANLHERAEAVAARMREVLRLSVGERRRLPTWEDALRQLIEKAEAAGVLVMASSVVGSNSHRKLDVGEFRGFALADRLAPLVFLNGADSKAAQMFTLAHELAHLWLGETGVSNTDAGHVPGRRVERWCNQVAAELLMPLNAVVEAHNPAASVLDEIQALSRTFKVSTLVALRRLFDADFIDEATLRTCYLQEQARLAALSPRSAGGGDFYRTLWARTGKRFATALVASTMEGQTLYRDAFGMLGIRSAEVIHRAARELGVTP